MPNQLINHFNNNPLIFFLRAMIIAETTFEQIQIRFGYVLQIRNNYAKNASGLEHAKAFSYKIRRITLTEMFQHVRMVYGIKRIIIEWNTGRKVMGEHIRASRREINVRPTRIDGIIGSAA